MSHQLAASSFVREVRDRMADELALRRWRLIGAAVLLVAVVTLWWLNSGNSSRAPAPEVSLPRAASTLPAQSAQLQGAEVIVQIAGAVITPGVYHVNTNARLGDVIAQAQGFAPDAQQEGVNLAAKITDGQYIYILRKGQTSLPQMTAGTGGADDKEAPIDVNSATADRLEDLPGVGPATAAAIIEYRTKHGLFRSVDDLSKVKGIGPSKIAQLRDRARV